MAVILRKPLQRVVRADMGRGQAEYVVTLYPEGTVGVRAKRSRTEYSVPLAVVFYRGAEAVARERMTKPKRKRRVKRGLLTTNGA